MKDVYENKTNLYIVMTLCKYGDLFDRLMEKKTFKERAAKEIIYKTLDACRYMHNLGVVHRDLKPENILMRSKNTDTDIVISDFGLSKFAAPHEKMDVPCGTLAYVAPEVLKMQGYGRKVDVWSIGCITHLLVRGHLPFDGKTKDTIINRTLRMKLTFSHHKWDVISAECKDIIRRLLERNVARRITIDRVMQHDWFKEIRAALAAQNSPKMKAAKSKPTSSDPIVMGSGSAVNRPSSPPNRQPPSGPRSDDDSKTVS